MAKKAYEVIDENGISMLEGSVEGIIYSNEENGYTIQIGRAHV